MEVFLPTKEEFDLIKKQLAEMRDFMKIMAQPGEQVFDNQQFIEMMKISDKTAADWRKKGRIGFSQEGRRIYYRMSDIELFLESIHTKPDFKDFKLKMKSKK